MSSELHMRTLLDLSGAFAGLMFILVGGMLSSGLLVPIQSTQSQILALPSTWQVPGLLLCSLVCGQRSAVISAIAYLIIGIFYVPIFHNGGGIDYLKDPSFGYLIGFIPAALFCGKFSERNGMNDILLLTAVAIIGIIILHISGTIGLVIGHLFNRWDESFVENLYSYSIAPLLGQLALCPAVGALSLILRRIILIE